MSLSRKVILPSAARRESGLQDCNSVVLVPLPGLAAWMGIAEPEVGVTITVQCPDNSDKVVHATPTSQSLPRGGKGRRRAMLLI